MENTENTYTPPALGAVRVEVRNCDDGTFFAHVLVYKANTLRGDSYWTTKAARTFKKKADALRWAGRFTA